MKKLSILFICIALFSAIDLKSATGVVTNKTPYRLMINFGPVQKIGPGIIPLVSPAEPGSAKSYSPPSTFAQIEFPMDYYNDYPELEATSGGTINSLEDGAYDVSYNAPTNQFIIQKIK